MANYRKLWIDWTEKRLVAGPTSLGTIKLPVFHKYETIPFQVGVIEADPDDPITSIQQLDVSNASLRMVINDTFDTATPLVEQTSWSKNTDTRLFTGELDLNVAGMNSYIGSDNSKTAYFEVQWVEGNVRTPIFQATINLRQGVAQPTTTSPDPLQTYRTAQESDGLYIGTRLKAGEMITFVSPDGSLERTIGIKDDGTPFDLTAPA